MTKIILGHTGFIGQSISKIFNNFEKNLIEISRDQIDFLSENSSKALKNVFSRNADVIMCIGIKKQYGDNFENWKKNEIILQNFVKSLILKPPRHLIYISSASIYGEDIKFENLISENTPINLRSFYGISKFNSENIIRKICENFNIPLLCLRPPLIYGKNDTSLGYGPTQFTYKAIEEKSIEIWGDGSEKREFIWVDDLAFLCKEIFNNKITGIVNTVSGKSYSYMEIIHELNKILGTNIKIIQKKRSKEKVDHNFSNSLHKYTFPNFKYTNLKTGLNYLCTELKNKQKK